MHRSREILAMWPSMTAESEVMGWGVSWGSLVRGALKVDASSSDSRAARTSSLHIQRRKEESMWGCQEHCGSKRLLQSPKYQGGASSKCEEDAAPAPQILLVGWEFHNISTRLPGAQWGSRPRGYLLVTNFWPALSGNTSLTLNNTTMPRSDKTEAVFVARFIWN